MKVRRIKRLALAYMMVVIRLRELESFLGRPIGRRAVKISRESL